MRRLTNMLLVLIVVGFAVTIYVQQPLAEERWESCSKDVVCVIVEKNGKNVDFLVENRQMIEITLTIEVNPLNLRSPVDFPYTATFPEEATTKAFTMTIGDPRQAWKSPYTYHWVVGNVDAVHDDSYVYTLPYKSGASYKVIQGFNGTFSHYGEQAYAIDWAMPEGTPVHAAREGIVVDIKDTNDLGGPDEEFKDYANYVRIKHSDGTIGEYDHFQQYGVNVQVGQQVKAGEVIGLSGNTGRSTEPHLHFWVFKAIDGERRESFPIKFKTHAQTPAILEQGKSYTAF